jgi:solute carrier family 26 (sodium-independent sulfate anion transporter), member 11
MTFVCGAVEFCMGVFKLGFIVDFISSPVVSSFSTSTSLIIIGAQLKNLLGIKFSAPNFPSTLVNLVSNLGETKLGDAAVGAFAIVFLMFLKNVKDMKLSSDHPYTPIIKKLLFYISISRNALIVVITSSFAYLLTIHYSEVPFKLSEKVGPGIPSFKLPEFSVEKDNRTIGFIEICGDIGSGLILLPLVSILANVAIAKSFCKSIESEQKHNFRQFVF